MLTKTLLKHPLLGGSLTWQPYPYNSFHRPSSRLSVAPWLPHGTGLPDARLGPRAGLVSLTAVPLYETFGFKVAASHLPSTLPPGVHGLPHLLLREVCEEE